MHNAQRDAQNIEHYVIISVLMQPSFKFQFSADHYGIKSSLKGLTVHDFRLLQ
jgi:hypothetical protein